MSFNEIPSVSQLNFSSNGCFDEDMMASFLLERTRAEGNEKVESNHETFPIEKICGTKKKKGQETSATRDKRKKIIYSNSVGNTTLLAQQKKSLKKIQVNCSNNNLQFSKGGAQTNIYKGILLKLINLKLFRIDFLNIEKK